MDKIYVVSKNCSLCDTDYVGYFSNKKDAEKYCVVNDCWFSEMECMDNTEIPDIEVNYSYEFVFELNENFSLENTAYFCNMCTYIEDDYIVGSDYSICVNILMPELDDNKAEVKANELLYKYLDYCENNSLNHFDYESSEKFNDYIEMKGGE